MKRVVKTEDGAADEVKVCCAYMYFCILYLLSSCYEVLYDQ